MRGYRIVWEDESKAREIELFVDYTLEDGAVQINGIRPQQVTFYCRQSRKPVRSIGIHTATGRRLLTEQYLAARSGEQSLEDEIRNQIVWHRHAVAAEIAS